MNKKKKFDEKGNCLKKKHFSKAGADAHIRIIQLQAKKQKGRKSCKVSHSYKCENCGYWHMTSSAPREAVI